MLAKFSRLAFFADIHHGPPAVWAGGFVQKTKQLISVRSYQLNLPSTPVG